MLSDTLGIEELRRDRRLSDASFLKSGPAGTVFPLTSKEGERLYQLICRRNPPALEVWPDLQQVAGGNGAILDIDTMDISASEGRQRFVLHLRIERNRQLIETKKKNVRRTLGTLSCEVRQFDFEKIYGLLGEGFCEVHHRKPLSRALGKRVTNLKDLAVVCSNCPQDAPPSGPFDLHREVASDFEGRLNPIVGPALELTSKHSGCRSRNMQMNL